MNILVGLHFEAHHIFLALCNALLHFLRGERQGVAHLHACTRVVLEIRYFCAFLLQLLGCVEGDIRMPRVQQLLHILVVYLPALALAIRTVNPLAVGRI